MISKLVDEYLAQALGVLLAIAVLVVAWQWHEAVQARGLLAVALESRATENSQRYDVALRDTKTVAAATAQHATDQQEIAHGLNEQKRSVAAVSAGRRLGVVRMRDTSADLDAAGDRLKAAADTATLRDLADQHRALLGLLQEAGRLLARSGELSAEAGELLGQRDAEVKALMAQIQADRALMARAAGLAPP